jgi:hypothetical protein
MQEILFHVYFQVSVFGIVPQIVEHKEFEEEKTDNENHRRNHDIACTNHDIVDTVDKRSTDNSKPETLNGFKLCESFPPKCFLCKCQIA